MNRNRTLQAFDRFASSLPGEVVIALTSGPGQDVLALGRDRGFHAWSTIKVPVLVALLASGAREPLTPEHRELATRAITESDNSAILELFELLKRMTGGSSRAGEIIGRLFQRSGDERTTVALAPPPPGAVTPFGQTSWTAGASARFFAALAAERLLDTAGTRYVLGLMERVIPEQRWGIGGLTVRTAFKGGWGPEADGTCLVRQSGVVFGGGCAPTAVSLVAVPPVGEDSFETGVQMVTQAARWIAKVHLI